MPHIGHGCSDGSNSTVGKHRRTDRAGVICQLPVSRVTMSFLDSILRFPRSVRVADNLRNEGWKRATRIGALAYILSRIFVVAGGAVAATSWAVQLREEGKTPPSGPTLLAQFLDMWDGKWYLEVVRSGYPRFIPDHVTYYIPEARAAFFPLYPRIVHYLDLLVPGGPVTTALLFNFILGAVFIYLSGRIALELYDSKVAEKVMVILCLFPGSFVLSFAYSEATLMVIACLCILALRRNAWIWAGVLAALGTLSRPNGIALVAACVVAAFFAIRDRRDYASLTAVVLSPLGFVGFMVFLRHQTGEKWAWFRVQRQAWDEGASFGGTAVARTFDFLTRPLSSPTSMVTAACVIALVILGVLCYRHRLPLEMTVYSLVIIFLMLLPATVTARPRFLYTAFPLFFPLAKVLRDDDNKWWVVVVSVLGASLVAFAGLYGVYGAVP